MLSRKRRKKPGNQIAERPRAQGSAELQGTLITKDTANEPFQFQRFRGSKLRSHPILFILTDSCPPQPNPQSKFTSNPAGSSPPAPASSSHACKSGLLPHPRAPANPAPSGYPSPPPADASQTNAST